MVWLKKENPNQTDLNHKTNLLSVVNFVPSRLDHEVPRYLVIFLGVSVRVFLDEINI